MAGRRGQFSASEQLRVGLAVLYERTIKRPRTKWKALERKYGRSRDRLWALAVAAQARIGIERGKIRQNSRKIRHLTAGAAPADGRILAASTSEDAMTGIFGGSSPAPAPAPAPATPTMSDPAVASAAAAQQQAAARNRGRAASILTGGMGVQQPAQLMAKSLLGQ